MAILIGCVYLNIQKLHLSFIEKHCDDNIWTWQRRDETWYWRWGFVSANPNMTMDIIEQNIDKPWDWWGISQNPNLTMEFIENHPNEEHPNDPWVWPLSL